MALQQEKRIGVGGLNLGADAGQLAEGALTIADGARYVELGAVHSRGGRKRAGLEWPAENAVSTTSYIDSIAHFRAGARVRGFAPYYDQRVWPTNASNVSLPLPTRLNYLYKKNGQLWFNHNYVNDDTDIVTGDGAFGNPNTVAKIIVYGDTAYIADEGTAPKAFRKKPKASQTFESRIKYAAGRMGMVWPTAGSSDPSDLTQKPTVVSASTAAITLAAGTFRFRIVLEDQFGKQSGPSMWVQWVQASGASDDALTISWATISSTFPAEAVNVLVYVQYTALVDTSAGAVIPIEPSDYLFVGRAAAFTGPQTMAFTVNDQVDMQNRPAMRHWSGAPPKLTELCIVNGIAYGASDVDIIYREEEEGQAYETYIERISTQIGFGQSRSSFRNLTKLKSKSTIKAFPVNRSYLFVSEPNEPEYMETFMRLGNGTEIIVGICPLGATPIVFTNERIYAIDTETLANKVVPASIGAISRDSIVPTERGIRFVSTDGVPRLFNGATVEEVATELLPIFDRDDYSGPYLQFDRANGQEVQGTYGDRRFYMTYPTAITPGNFKPGTTIDALSSRDLAVGDESRGRTMWSIDRFAGYETVHWLGRESRLLGIDTLGDFYFIEEGLTQEFASGSGAPYFEVATRRFSLSGLESQFYAIEVEGDSGDAVALFLECRVDNQPDLVETYLFQTDGRETKKFLLPSYFKGRYLDVRLWGEPIRRAAIYRLTPEMARRGEFS